MAVAGPTSSRLLAVTLVYHVVLTSLAALTGCYVWYLRNEVRELAVGQTKEQIKPTNIVEKSQSNIANSSTNPSKRQVNIPSWVTGPPGPPGREGRDGLPGPQGPPGPSGNDAVNFAQIDNQINTAVEDLINKERENFRNAARSVPKVAGTTYVRWGRTECPSSSSMVYKGQGGGSWYMSGGGSNIQCFPEDPSYLTTTGAHIDTRIYGVEYEAYNGQYLDRLKRVHDKNMPCIVCQAKGRAAALMTPASIKCQDGWTFEYNGYLMAGGPGHKRNTFMCIDKDPEGVQGKDGNANGELIYHTTIDCGNFGSCPPYKTNAEIACVVCTK